MSELQVGVRQPNEVVVEREITKAINRVIASHPVTYVQIIGILECMKSDLIRESSGE